MGDIFSEVDALIEREGGDRFTNDPHDPGGPTKFGITGVTLGAARGLGRAATADEVQALQRPEAVSIYTKKYISDPGIDLVARVSPALAVRLFDIAVNSGPLVGIGFMQTALNAFNRRGADYADVPVSGGCGPLTMQALSAFRARRGSQADVVLETAVQCLEGARYLSQGAANQNLEDYEFGWFANRVILGR